MAGRTQESNTKLGKWLRGRDISITDFSKDVGVCYRTAWLAVHGYCVSYDTASKICQYVGDDSGMKLDSFCSAPSRSEFEPTVLE